MTQAFLAKLSLHRQKFQSSSKEIVGGKKQKALGQTI